MRPGNALPEGGELSLKNERDEEQRVALRLVGPSSQGLIYRSTDGADYYRLIPLRDTPAVGGREARHCDEAPIERRHAIRRWTTPVTTKHDAAVAWTQDPEAFNLAAIVATDLGHLNGISVLCIRYGVRAARTMIDVLANRDPLVRIDHAILLLRALPVWRMQLDTGLLPMPADIVFSDRGYAYLLPVPFWRLPDVDSVFAAPARVLYLAPEYVRGVPGTVREPLLDAYAVGAILMQCFHRAPPLDDPSSILLRAATGSLWLGLTLDLPFWMQSLEPAREAVSAIRRTLDGDLRVRAAFDPLQLAERLVNWRHRMTPRYAVEELVRAGHLPEAYVLLQDALFTEESRAQRGSILELFLQAARLARDLRRPFEAVDFFEKAISEAPDRSDVYEEQLRFLLSPAVQEPLVELTGSQGDPGAQVEAQVCRDFEHIDPNHQTEDLEAEIARYLLRRPDAYRAANFIYSQLFDAQGKFLWWRYQLWLLYVQALLRLGQPRQAEEQLNSVRRRLGDAFRAGRMDEAEMAIYRPLIESLKAEIEQALGSHPARRS